MEISFSMYSGSPSRTITFSTCGSSGSIFLIFGSCWADTITYFASECLILNTRSLDSSSLIESGTFTAPAYRIPSSPVTQRFRPSDSRATFSPFCSPRAMSPAPILCPCSLVWANVVCVHSFPRFSHRNTLEEYFSTYLSTNWMIVSLGVVMISVLLFVFY